MSRSASTASGTQVNLFDLSPIRIGGFILRGRTVEPEPLDEDGTPIQPTIQGWQEAMTYASASEESSPYWVGQLLVYAEDREDWKEKLSQAMTATNLAQQTLENRATLVRKVAEPERQLAPSPSHAAEVTSLPKDEQRKWLKKAKTEGWTRNELRAEIRASKRTKVLEGQAKLEGMYRVIYADCPWIYSDSGATKDGSLGKAERHFTGMTIEQLCKLPVAAHALPNAVLFFWVTAPLLFQNPGPREVVEAWGFTYKSNRVWDKVVGLPGHYGIQITHEHLIIAVRGDGQPDVPLPNDDSVLVERRGDEHSGKPESMRQWIEKHWTIGPRLELFGRRRVKGWDVFGNDARLWSQDVKRTA